jgi:rhodanese-related sulfurtransferase
VNLNELFDAAAGRIRRYTPEEARAATQAGAAIVDLRTQDARNRDGVVPGAYHVPRTVLEWRVASDDYRHTELDGKRLILICDHGCSSVLAAATLVDLGRDAGDVIGGFAAWRAAGLATGVAKPFEGLPGTGPRD